MRRRGSRSVFWHWPVLLLTLVSSACAADPRISKHVFEHQPYSLLWFDDSDTILAPDVVAGSIWRSTDAGVEWKEVDLGKREEADLVLLSPHNNKVALALGRNTLHWITKDQGKSWTSFKTDYPYGKRGSPVSFHATDPDKIIINTFSVDEKTNKELYRAVYTTNGFKDVEKLRDSAKQCLWAKERAQFDSGDSKKDDKTALCIIQGKGSSREDLNRLVVSDSFFDRETEPELEDGKPQPGVVNMVTATKYILAARRDEGSEALSMYTTTDSIHWNRALFGSSKLVSNGYTVMESTNYSIQVDVKVPTSRTGMRSHMGMLFTSNSEGTNFIRNEDYTNRNEIGIVDFEKVQNVQGVYLTNIVSNGEDVISTGAPKLIQSRITFDDGRTFRPLHGFGADGKQEDELQLLSVTEMQNTGRVFSTPSPGILIGVGSLGKHLKDLSECNTYVSENGGLTWHHSLKGPHKYEVGDSGGIVVAIWSHSKVHQMLYSLERGDIWSWQTLVLEKDAEKHAISPTILTTMPDSTGKKFVLLGYDSEEQKTVLYSIDFNPLDLGKCKPSQFEKWTARSHPNEEDSTCIMGHSQTFERRKKDQICFVDRKYHEEEPDTEQCPCTAADYECDTGFIRSKDDVTKCEPVGSSSPGSPQPGDCEDIKGTYTSPSGFRKIPGNVCQVKTGIDLMKDIERPCGGGDGGGSGDRKGIKVYINNDWDATLFIEKVYLEYSDKHPADETVFALTDRREVYVSHDHGRRWENPLPDEEIVAVYPHRYSKDDAYFITVGTTGFYTRDRGFTMHEFNQPSPPSIYFPALRFHETNPNWLLWTGCVEKSHGDAGNECESGLWRSTNGGDEWHQMKRGVENCEFIYHSDRDGDDDSLEKMVYCVDHLDENRNGLKSLTASDDWFEHKPQELVTDILNFATHSEFIVVAKRDETSGSLKLDCSVDGKHFAPAHFPKALTVKEPAGYTVLDSSTHSIFLHVTENSQRDQEHGTIVKSNSNGTSFVVTLPGVNRDHLGYADFEKMLSLDGAAIANVVSNVDSVNTGSIKKLKTKFSHNDGADWRYLAAPAVDNEDRSYGCDVTNLEKCSLHFFGYTDRADPRDTYSSPTATGIVLGVGTVGEYLGSKKDSDTFISRDGGITWHTAMKGPHMWEFGDQGSVIVLVEEAETKYVWYSTDEGQNWSRLHFSEDVSYRIDDITTLPSDGSLKFLLWGFVAGRVEQPATITLDFSSYFDGPCDLSTEDVGKDGSDYYWWTPRHPTQDDDCLFGHVYRYVRRRPNANCYNGKTMNEMKKMQGIKDDCECSNIDFECDYNYVRGNDNRCELVEGLEPLDPYLDCSDPSVIGYRNVTGYRKIPLDTCHGGNEDQRLGQWNPCPGHEIDFDNKYGRKGISGVGLFFAIVVPVVAAVGFGYWAYTAYTSKFGRIRLGDAGGSARRALDTNSALIRYPVAVLSGVAAVAMAVPAVLAGLFRWGREKLPGRRSARANGGWRSATTRPYTSRDAFARSRGSYQAVGNDETDLLGEESDEEA